MVIAGRAGWASAGAVSAAVRVKWDRGALLRDLHAPAGEWSAFPVRVRLPGPAREELPARFADAAAWASELAAAAGRDGWTLQTRTVRVGGLGNQQLPVAAVVATPHDGLRLLGRAAAAAAARFTTALSCAERLGPEARGLALARPHDVLAAASDWPLLLDLADWIRAHPRPGIYPRQIPVAGVHTKVLERNTTLLARLLDALLPTDSVDPAAKTFTARFGFAAEPRRVRVRGAATLLGVPYGDVADVEWDVAALAAIDPARSGVNELLVLENKTSYLTVPTPPGRLVLWGAGYGVDELLGWLPWRHHVVVRYWGDIDTHGFAMLARVRTVAPHTASVLMDAATLLAHRPFWSTEGKPRRDPLPTLTPDEQEVYAALCTNAHGRGVRLEQEFIRFDIVAASLSGGRGGADEVTAHGTHR